MKMLTKVTFSLALVIPAIVVNNAGLASAETVGALQTSITVEMIATDAYRMREYRADNELVAVYVAPISHGSPYLLVANKGQADFIRVGMEDWPQDAFLESKIFSILRSSADKASSVIQEPSAKQAP